MGKSVFRLIPFVRRIIQQAHVRLAILHIVLRELDAYWLLFKILTARFQGLMASVMNALQVIM